ncbi:ORF6N domain-containing protein [Legionella bozemanae]|uniref:ORF6N domain protein n=1 Tax=Legionella bozemanae TaxID=447 RepID=A0A0W0REK9_LEGBO|nr:ORF6N domain-containing protein [Legionella bozemanae]KTC69542.1 ORF6N domain protein [Legionella bozemanae]STP10061.1 ORF6N domain [Legionella bozemanae]
MTLDLILTKDELQKKIYEIRGIHVMLDKDLADLYGVKPIRLREQVKRNIKRFPEDFMFQLTPDEVEILLSQNAIPSKKSLGGFLPYVFTEQGVAGISGVLTSERAIAVNITIMRTFVEMRRFLSLNGEIINRLSILEKRQIVHEIKATEQFEKIFNALEDRRDHNEQGVFYDGQIFDAYLFVSKLIRAAKSSIILLDNYIDESVLEQLAKSKPNVQICILTKNISNNLKLDIKKYNEQYKKMEFVQFSLSHDRFLIIDDHDIYHIGASLKDLGKKWFAFSKLECESFGLMEQIKNAIKTSLSHNL